MAYLNRHQQAPPPTSRNDLNDAPNPTRRASVAGTNLYSIRGSIVGTGFDYLALIPRSSHVIVGDTSTTNPSTIAMATAHRDVNSDEYSDENDENHENDQHQMSVRVDNDVGPDTPIGQLYESDDDDEDGDTTTLYESDDDDIADELHCLFGEVVEPAEPAEPTEPYEEVFSMDGGNASFFDVDDAGDVAEIYPLTVGNLFKEFADLVDIPIGNCLFKEKLHESLQLILFSSSTLNFQLF